VNTKTWDIINANYLASAVKVSQYPVPALEEIAFIGRSNVGKSSLINSLTRRKGLARVSSSPGKTQTINFYDLRAKCSGEEELRKQFYLVDLPGYGFARTSKDNKNQWSAFIGKYLEDSPKLKLVCQLLDIRHNLMESDLACYQWLATCGIPVIVILTKSDKLSKSAAQNQVNKFKRDLGLNDERILAYSATNHLMRGELIERIMQYID
jgi:GTP-binding protein